VLFVGSEGVTRCP